MLTSVLSSSNLSVMLRQLRFNVLKCGEKSPTLRIWLIRKLVRPTLNKTNRSISMPKLVAHKCVLMTLPVSLTPVVPICAPSKLPLKTVSVSS